MINSQPVILNHNSCTQSSYAGSLEVRIIVIYDTSVQLFVVSQVRSIENLTFYGLLLCYMYFRCPISALRHS